MSIQSRAPKIMRYINNTQSSIKKPSTSFRTNPIPSTPVPSPFWVKNVSVETGFNKLIKSTMLQLR
jgi:hypothetical protein